MVAETSPAPRRVLMTADTIGGVWTYALELARALAAFEVQVVLATMGSPLSRSQRIEAEGIAKLSLHESQFALEWMNNPWGDLDRASDWLLELARSAEPDLIHLNGYVHGALAWERPVLIVGHSCVLSWWRAVKGQPAPPAWDRYREAVTRGIQASDQVAAPSSALLASLKELYGPLPPSRVIANGRDSQLFRPGLKQPYILAAGRLWDEAKNLDLLAKVAPSLPWPIKIAGDNAPPDGSVHEFPAVQWLGRLSTAELSAHYRRASIYALPARYEPFGLSAVEAALAGCALVLGDVPSLREVWDESALFVDPDNAENLKVTLQALIDQPCRRAELARRARERALAYSPRRMAEAYVSLYQELAAGAAPNRCRTSQQRQTSMGGPGAIYHRDHR
ncbi:MAG TPA: glycosyltransferase family 4 protein [Isosphaeraceae bacterium]|nr:glycosyltransferase family 4 protein [Isosphaeraceae bacterium]